MNLKAKTGEPKRDFFKEVRWYWRYFFFDQEKREEQSSDSKEPGEPEEPELPQNVEYAENYTPSGNGKN